MVVPTIYWVDEVGGCLGMEMVRGWSVREILGGGAEGEGEIEEEENGEGDGVEVGDGGGVGHGVGDGGIEGGLAQLGLEEEESEGMQALRGLGVSVGPSIHLKSGMKLIE